MSLLRAGTAGIKSCHGANTKEWHENGIRLQIRYLKFVADTHLVTVGYARERNPKGKVQPTSFPALSLLARSLASFLLHLLDFLETI